MSRQPFDRRRFLQFAPLGAATALTAPKLLAQAPTPNPPLPFPPLTLPPWLAPTERQNGQPENPLPPDQRIGYAVVGLGRLALTQVLPAFGQSRYSKLTALVSGNPQKASQVAAEYGVPASSIYNYDNFDQIANNPQVNVVYIILPNSLHMPFTVRAAAAGKHVLSEKPMARTVAECDQMIAACQAANKQLMVANRIEYEPYNRAMRDLVRAGTLGTNIAYEASNTQNMGDPTQWRLNKDLAGGGALYDIGIYCLYTIRYLTGQEPNEVAAHIYTPPNDPRFTQVEATINFRLSFPSGLQATCYASYTAHQSNRYRIHGSDAWAQMDPAFSYSGLRMQGSRKLSESYEEASVPTRQELNQFALEMDHFSLALLQNQPVFTPGQEGRQDIYLLQQIYQAAASGQPVSVTAPSGLDPFRGPLPTSPNQ